MHHDGGVGHSRHVKIRGKSSLSMIPFNYMVPPPSKKGTKIDSSTGCTVEGREGAWAIVAASHGLSLQGYLAHNKQPAPPGPRSRVVKVRLGDGGGQGRALHLEALNSFKGSKHLCSSEGLDSLIHAEFACERCLGDGGGGEGCLSMGIFLHGQVSPWVYHSVGIFLHGSVFP